MEMAESAVKDQLILTNECRVLWEVGRESVVVDLGTFTCRLC